MLTQRRDSWVRWGWRRTDKVKQEHRNVYTTTCKTDHQGEFAVWHRELKPGGLWQPRDVGTEREFQDGGDVYPWLIHADVWQKPTQYWKAIIFQLKILKILCLISGWDEWLIFLYLSLAPESESRSVMSNCLWPHELYSPWNSPGQNTGVGSLSLHQGIFPIQSVIKYY